MSWTFNMAQRVWHCSAYTDLNYATITNLAEFGQPMSPYESGFVQDFVPDFKKVIVEMPQGEVMNHGFGRNVNARGFPVVHRFLQTTLSLPFGSYSFDQLVKRGFARPKERFVASNLYGTGNPEITPANVGGGDAAYIYGSVSFALMQGTSFTLAPQARRVEAVLGAVDDNWDFTSSNPIVNIMNPFVAAVFGPDHYNLEAPITIRFRGTGRRSFAQENLATTPKTRHYSHWLSW